MARRLGIGRPMIMSMSLALVVYLFSAIAGGLAAMTIVGPAVTANTARLSLWWVFIHNLGTCLWLTVGLFSGGIITIGVLGLNGMILGWVAEKQYQGGHGGLVISGILPHMPLELLAYVVSGGATMLIAVRLFASFFGKRPSPTAVGWRTWIIAQILSVVLLFIAAIVETYIAHA